MLKGDRLDHELVGPGVRIAIQRVQHLRRHAVAGSNGTSEASMFELLVKDLGHGQLRLVEQLADALTGEEP